MSQNKRFTWGARAVSLLMVVALAISLSACGKDKNDNKNSGKESSGNTAATKTDPNKVVVEYKGGTVTQKQLDAFLGVDKMLNSMSNPYYSQYEAMPSFKEDMAKQLVAYRFLSEKATDAEAKKAGDEAKKQVKDLQDQLSKDKDNKKSYEDMLKQLNIGYDDISDYVALRLKVMSVMTDKFPDDAVKKEYDTQIAKDKNAFIDTATVSHILIALKDATSGKELRTKEEALKRAKEVKTKLDAGGDFAKLAKEYSDDGSKDQGGSLGEKQDINQWVEPFKKAVIEQPLNKVGNPVESEFGYHLIKVEWRNPNDFTTVKETVRGQLASNYYGEVLEKEIPKLDLKFHLPKPAKDTGSAGNAGSSNNK